MASFVIPGVLLELVLFDSSAYLLNAFARYAFLPTIADKCISEKRLSLCGTGNETHTTMGIIPALGSSDHWGFNMGEFSIC